LPGGVGCAEDHVQTGVDDLSRDGSALAASGGKEEPEDLLVLPGLVAALPALEREVIVLRFFQDLDQYEIAARVGCSQMHVSRLQRRALARMHGQLVES
jgi:RNA polymerase sigma-B factor